MKGGTKGLLFGRSLGSPENAYDMVMDLPAVSGAFGIATTAAVGLYLYKKRRPTSTTTKNMKHSAPDPMEIV